MTLHIWDDIITAILAGIASFLAILAAAATGWADRRGAGGSKEEKKRAPTT